MALYRSYRQAAWNILHAVIPCGTMLSSTALRQPDRADNPPPPQSRHIVLGDEPAWLAAECLTHMFLECRVIITVWDWI